VEGMLGIVLLKLSYPTVEINLESRDVSSVVQKKWPRKLGAYLRNRLRKLLIDLLLFVLIEYLFLFKPSLSSSFLSKAEI
jgi:hypothetical protein